MMPLEALFAPVLVAQDWQELVNRLLPWLIPVLLGLIGVTAQIVSWMVERRARKMERYQQEGGGYKRPSVPAEPREAPSPQPKRTILDEVRRFMEMVEERTLGDEEGETGRKVARRRKTDAPAQPTEPDATAPPRKPAEPAPTRQAPPPRGRTVTIGPDRRKPGTLPPEITRPEPPDEGTPAAAALLRDDPFSTSFWALSTRMEPGGVQRPPLDRRSLRRAVLLSEILAPPVSERPPDSPLGPPL